MISASLIARDISARTADRGEINCFVFLHRANDFVTAKSFADHTAQPVFIRNGVYGSIRDDVVGGRTKARPAFAENSVVERHSQGKEAPCRTLPVPLIACVGVAQE